MSLSRSNFSSGNLSKQGSTQTKGNKGKIKVCIRVRPLLEHEDMEFWQVDSQNNTIYTDNYYTDQSEIINESYAMTYLANKSYSIAGNRDIKKALLDSIYAPQKFMFDRVYSMDISSQIIYKEMCRDAVESVVKGYNGSIFMYGQTTSGKTFTMLGSPNSPGILPCVLRDIFLTIQKSQSENPSSSFSVFCSYIEIYNECHQYRCVYLLQILNL